MFHAFANKIRNKYGFANLFFYAAAIAFAVIVKIYYRQVESFPGDPFLMLFLKPLSAIVGLFFGIHFEFDAAKGFFNRDLNVVIGSSCAGINFFVIVFCMLAFTFIKLFGSIRQKAAVFAAFIAVAYAVSILANTSRIIASISILDMNLLPAGLEIRLLHELTGILFYLVYLICSFYIAKIILSKVGSSYEAST